MEPAPFKMSFQARVSNVEERFTSRYLGGVGKDAHFEKHTIGFYVHLVGSWESVFAGMTQPHVKAGDMMKVTMEKIANA